MTAAAIDWGQLVELVWASALGSLVVSATFALVILGVTRAADLRRADRGATATAYAALALVAGLLFVGTVAFGITVILAK